jgi:hypothetical protein
LEEKKERKKKKQKLGCDDKSKFRIPGSWFQFTWLLIFLESQDSWTSPRFVADFNVSSAKTIMKNNLENLSKKWTLSR